MRHNLKQGRPYSNQIAGAYERTFETAIDADVEVMLDY
jgi:hypothetical protein